MFVLTNSTYHLRRCKYHSLNSFVGESIIGMSKFTVILYTLLSQLLYALYRLCIGFVAWHIFLIGHIVLKEVQSVLRL